jgi:UDP-glucose 4-epimerase
MKILITGSSGQIGTNLALRLLEEGHDVFGVDIRANTWTEKIRCSLQDLSCHYPSHSAGIGGVEYPTADLVVHLAAHAKVHQLVQQPHRALENVIMTYNVLEFCRQTRTPVIFSSSREVYGDIHRFNTEEENADFAYTESTYSASKIAGEALVYSYGRCYGLPYLVFRFSNVYGRYDNDIERMERVIPLFVRRIACDELITIYGPEKVLDFTHVDDCVDGIVRGIHALAEGRVKGETINLAYGQGNTLGRMAELVAGTLGKKLRVTTAPALMGEVTRYVANITQARKLLGYEPKVALEEGIWRSVEWSREWAAAHGTTLARPHVPTSETATTEGLEFKPSASATGR